VMARWLILWYTVARVVGGGGALTRVKRLQRHALCCSGFRFPGVIFGSAPSFSLLLRAAIATPNDARIYLTRLYS